MGRQLKQSVNVFQSLILNLRLPVVNPHTQERGFVPCQLSPKWQLRALQQDERAVHTLVVKPVNAVDGCAFMVPPKNEKVFGILDFVGEEKANGLERLLPAIDVVAQEEVIGLWREAAILKETKQVVILAMDIAANFDGRFKFEKDRLVDKDVARLEAKMLDLIFLQVDWLARSRAADCGDASAAHTRTSESKGRMGKARARARAGQAKGDDTRELH